MNPIALPLAFQEATAAPGFVQFVPILLIFGIFYFLLIAPMRKRQKALQELISNLNKGDKVVTSGGLYGEIAALEERTVLLRIADNVKVRVARSAISGLEGQEPEGGAQ